jgi:general stress protein 26
MAAMSIEELSEKMRSIDFCMLSTREASGGISTRPMSNNGDVEYDGDSCFFRSRIRGKSWRLVLTRA